MRFAHFVAILVVASFTSISFAAEPAAAVVETQPGDQMIADYFRAETALLADRSLADIHTLEDWTSRREEYRRQLLEMLGLDPLPERTDLMATVTGTVDHQQFTVENLHFQSRPGLYVTANLYVPKGLTTPAPAILYVCGHGPSIKDGVSYGNKVTYQHHPGWFARHGYVCLVIDTLQLGEIQGIHHGTYSEDMWWWNSRGYTPAGVEAWNCVRALDYLQSRPEVDGERIGVTGRSGGGAYSWWIAAIDERIKAAVPVAGITDLTNHVVDGTVEGHCDCMFMLNTYRWDYAQVAALVAPRPLLISNTDKDGIFPLEGVVRVHEKVRHIYRLYGAADKLGLQITEGPHEDRQELHIHAFHWFNRFLKGETPPIDQPAQKFFQPEQLRVFTALPTDQINTRVHEVFVPAAAEPEVPENEEEWAAMRDGWMTALREKVFRGWPEEEPLDVSQAWSVEKDGILFSAYDFTSQGPLKLRIYMVRPLVPGSIDLIVVDDEGWKLWLAILAAAVPGTLDEDHVPAPNVERYQSVVEQCRQNRKAFAIVAPRGIGATAWDRSDFKQVQNRRRFLLLGQTLDGMRAWDIRRSVHALRSMSELTDVPLAIWANGEMAADALYASLFLRGISKLSLTDLPVSHAQGPELLNVLRYLDIPQALALASERSQVVLDTDAEAWSYPQAVVERLGWGSERFVIDE